MDYIDYLMNINENEGTQDPILKNIYSPVKRPTPTPTPARRPSVPPVNFGKPSTQPSMWDSFKQAVGGMFDGEETQQSKKPILVPYQPPQTKKTVAPTTNRPLLNSAPRPMPRPAINPMLSTKNKKVEDGVSLARDEAGAIKKVGEDYLKDMANVYDIPTVEGGKSDISDNALKLTPTLEKSYSGYKQQLNREEQALKEYDSIITEKLPVVEEAEAKAENDSQNAYTKMQIDLQNSIDSLDNIEKEISLLSDEEIDPSRYWKDKTTGQKVMMGIGLIMAAMTPESMKLALNGIEKQIDQDINAQKTDIARKILGAKERTGAVKTKVEYYTRLFDNKQAGTLAAKNASLLAVKRQLDAKKDQTANQGAISNIEKTKAEIDAIVEKNNQQIINSKREQLGTFAGLKYQVGEKAAKSIGLIRDALEKEAKNKIDIYKSMKVDQNKELDTKIKQKRLEIMEHGQKPKLTAEENKVYMFYTQTLPLVNQMYDALKAGSRTFTYPFEGDNRFTIPRNKFTNYLGRPETGATMPESELEMYRGFLPTKWDSKEIRIFKLSEMLREMQQRKEMIEKNARRELIPAKGK